MGETVMRVLITGASGFVGPRLVRRLTETFPNAQIWAYGGASQGTMPSLNLLDPLQVDTAVAESSPTHIVHLAGQSSVGSSLDGAADTWTTNFDGTAMIARSVRKHSPGATFVFASSGEVYGESFNLGPRDERSPILPKTPYARSKAAAEGILEDLLGPVCTTVTLRLFNHTGPGQDERFVIPSFASQIVKAELGLGPSAIAVGNLAAERDFTDVDDIVDAYIAVIKAEDLRRGFHLFNVGSGRLRPIRDVLQTLIASSEANISVRTDPARVRPIDVPRGEGVFLSFNDTFGWAPRRDFENTLSSILSYWRERHNHTT